MRIATWNIERLKHKKQMNTILSECDCLGADILILTETDTSVKPDFKYYYKTELLQGITEPVIYNDTENRVSIFTNIQPLIHIHLFVLRWKQRKGTWLFTGLLLVS